MNKILQRIFGNRSVWLPITMLTSIGVSVAAVPYAIWWGHAVDGGRGGAIGCALTFFMFFIGRPTAEQALEGPLPSVSDFHDILVAPAPEDLKSALAQLHALKSQLARCRGAIAVILDTSNQEKVYLAAASSVSTLMWGFGDLVAARLGAVS
jgi:hypothetical protein